ncbi:MAG: sigma-70 family RNA polymerase sigma factor [Acidimicrobiales bacterium]
MDLGAFDRWYSTEHPKLLSTLVVVGGDLDRAQDAVDEAFARAYERWGRVSEMTAPTAWTYQTALNVLKRRGRRAAMEARLHRRRAETSISAPADWSPEVWEALRSLPVRERTAIALRYVVDLSTEDIATAMRIAPGTVGSTLNAARRHLASTLGDERESLVILEEAPDG